MKTQRSLAMHPHTRFWLEDHMDGIRLIDETFVAQRLRSMATSKYRIKYGYDSDKLKAFAARLKVSRVVFRRDGREIKGAPLKEMTTFLPVEVQYTVLDPLREVQAHTVRYTEAYAEKVRED